MRRIAATRRGIATAAIVLATALSVGLLPAPAHAATDLEREMLRLTNEDRAAHGVGRLRLDDVRSDTAHRHSAAMARAGGLYHTANAESVYLRGVRWTRWGENVGRTEGDLAGLQDAFMDSPVHRRNLLERRFDKVAVGVVRRDGTAWVTLFFYG
jgi:uncharacterized protein YkwD